MAQRILIVDDDRYIVRILSSYFEQGKFIVLTAYDGEAAMQTIRAERPDLVILDLMLPGMDGLEIARRMRSDPRLAATPILMLTARVDDADKLRGFERGADDYVTKPFNPEEIVARARAILRRAGGQVVFTRHILQVGGLRLDTDAYTASLDEQRLDLTPTEFALLKVLMAQPDHTFTRAELIEKALGYAYEGMDRTLDSHIKNLRRKIEPEADSRRYIETVYGVGYRLREAE